MPRNTTTLDSDAGMAIEHTAVRQMRGTAFGAPIVKNLYSPLPITRNTEGPREKRKMSSKQLVSGIKPGDKVDSYFSVSYKKPVQDYKYGAMFEFRASDKSGQITVKYWGGQDKASVEALHNSFDKEQVVQVRGEAQEYKGLIEISVSEKNGGALKRLEEGEYDISQLIKTYENIEDMKKRILELTALVQEKSLRKLLDSFFKDDDFMTAFAAAPASITLHSAAVGGLMFHTIHVAELCASICDLHPDLDRDLVITGALLHDIGKIEGFKVTSNISSTERGNLVGHIILADEELRKRIERIEGFPEALGSKIRHIVLSHHGRKEWGSPVEPMFPEALAVHEADDLDAKLDNMITKRNEAVTEDDWIWDPRHSRLIFLR